MNDNTKIYQITEFIKSQIEFNNTILEVLYQDKKTNNWKKLITIKKNQEEMLKWLKK